MSVIKYSFISKALKEYTIGNPQHTADADAAVVTAVVVAAVVVAAVVIAAVVVAVVAALAAAVASDGSGQPPNTHDPSPIVPWPKRHPPLSICAQNDLKQW